MGRRWYARWTARPYGDRVLVSFVVRLRPEPLADGVLAGEVEHAVTGARGHFRDAAELAAWCAQQASPAPRALPRPAALRLCQDGSVEG